MCNGNTSRKREGQKKYNNYVSDSFSFPPSLFLLCSYARRPQSGKACAQSDCPPLKESPHSFPNPERLLTTFKGREHCLVGLF